MAGAALSNWIGGFALALIGAALSSWRSFPPKAAAWLRLAAHRLLGLRHRGAVRNALHRRHHPGQCAPRAAGGYKANPCTRCRIRRRRTGSSRGPCRNGKWIAAIRVRRTVSPTSPALYYAAAPLVQAHRDPAARALSPRDGSRLLAARRPHRRQSQAWPIRAS